ncbi:MAG: cyclic nucleotide-binding domain-containing protein [Desulfobulbales bacterium]|jgi:CRP-like cAMP-binding protein
MNELKELLGEHHAVVTFDDEEIEILAETAEQVEIEPGDILFREQDPADSVYLVIFGAVNLYSCFNENIDQTIMTVRTGGFVGILAIIDDQVRDINARAVEKTKAYKFDREKLHTLIAEENNFGVKFLRLLNDLLGKRLHIAISSLRQNLEWTMQVSGLASLDISQLIVDRVNIVIELVNGKQLEGIIMKAENHPAGFELFVKTSEGNIHFIPYHSIVSASVPLESIKTTLNDSSGM